MKNDLTSKKTIAEILSQKLLNNMQAAIDRISHTMHKNKSVDLTEAMLSDVMYETFDFNKMNRHEPLNTKLPLPRILFGINTNNSVSQGPSKTNMRNAYWKPDQSALHFTLENVEAMSMIRVARTYFLTSNAPRIYKVTPVFNDEGYENSYDLEKLKDSEFTDEFKLTNIYCKIVQTYLKFTSSLATNLTAGSRDKLKQIIEKKVLGNFYYKCFS